MVSSQSNWAPISVQENTDDFFDKLPDVQYSMYSSGGAGYTSTGQRDAYKRDVSRSFEVVEHSEVLNQSSMKSENSLGPDLIDLNTLKIWDSGARGNDFVGRQTTSKHPLVKDMEMGGSRFSVDLESVLSDKSRQTDSVSGQTDFIDEMEQRIKKLREVQLSSSFRSKKSTEQKHATQSSRSAIKPKPQSAQANSNVASAQLSSLSRSVDMSTANLDPLHSMSSSSYNTSATTTANVFTCSSVGRRKSEQSTLTTSKNVQGIAGCQKSLPRNSTDRAECAQLSARRPDSIVRPTFTASKPGFRETLPTAPPYEMLSSNTLKVRNVSLRIGFKIWKCIESRKTFCTPSAYLISRLLFMTPKIYFDSHESEKLFTGN